MCEGSKSKELPMIETNMNSSSDLNTTDALRSIFKEVGLTMEEVELPGDEDSPPVSGSLRTLQSALVALSEGRVRALVEQFADSFRFNDHALTLEFTDKARLTDFFEKSRELFPDTALEIVSLFEDGDRAIAQWKLSATQIVPYGAISYRFPISLFGATIVRVENGKIVEWSDYYDQSSSRRMSLGAFFTDCIEY
jgi:ketosteroid isomerase-like protein